METCSERGSVAEEQLIRDIRVIRGQKVRHLRVGKNKICRNGFTLVELLVTIGILAMLAAILVPTIGKAIQKAEIAKAQMEMSNISSAIRAYYKEYGIMPVFSGNGNDDHTFGAKNTPATKKQNEVIDILRDDDTAFNPNHTRNSRRIVFLEVPIESMEGTDKNGTTYEPGEGYYLDPWGNPYLLCMDTDFDGEIGLDPGAMDGIGSPAWAAIQGMTQFQGPGWAVFPGVTAGVMSWGPDPTDEDSFMVSWGMR